VAPNITDVNYIDIVLAVFLLWGAVKGFKNGLIIETASLAALFLGIYGALRFSFYTSDILADKLHMTTSYLHLLSFAVTFVVIVILVHLLAKALDKLVKAVALGFINRFTGLLLGIIKIAFLLSLLLLPVNALNRKTHFLPEDKIRDSLLYEPVSRFVPALFMYLHFDIQQPFEKPKSGANAPLTI